MKSEILYIKNIIGQLQELSNKEELSSSDFNKHYGEIKSVLENLDFDFKENDSDKKESDSDALFFHVMREFLYLKNNVRAVSRKKGKNLKPCKEFFAIVNVDEDYTISCVDDSYILVTNKQVLEYAKLLFCHLFETDGLYRVIDRDQTYDKSKADFDIVPDFDSESVKFSDDKRGEKWSFFLRISNNYKNNIKKYYAGFINKTGNKKVILTEENGITLTVKNIRDYNINESIELLILKEIVSKNLGNLDQMKSDFIELLNRLDTLKIPQIFKTFFFCEDFKIKESVTYIEKINKEIKEGKVISADKQKRRACHEQKLKDFKQLSQIYKKDYTVYDLFTDYIECVFKEAKADDKEGKEERKLIDDNTNDNNETFHSRYYLPVIVGKWLQTIEARIDKLQSVVLSNLDIIKRIAKLDLGLFLEFEDNLKKCYEDEVNQIYDEIDKNCIRSGKQKAGKCVDDFNNDISTENYFKTKKELNEILQRYRN